MKIGIIADIHSNIYAFRACMEYLEREKCDVFFLLGDFISDTPYARETMDYLYEVMKRHECHMLRGNRENYMLSQRRVLRGKEEGVKWIEGSGSGNLLFTYRRLTEADLDFFERLPISFTYELKGYPVISCAHGSMENDRRLLQLWEDTTKEYLDKMDTEFLIAAHTHLQGTLEHNGKTYINTGSCGIAIGAPGMAHCAMMETCEYAEPNEYSESGKQNDDIEQNTDIVQSIGGNRNKRSEQSNTNKKTWKCSLLAVPYDVEQVVADIYSSGLYEIGPWFASSNIHNLRTGIDKTAELVQLAIEKQKTATGAANWPYIDEIYYQQAAAELQIPDANPKNNRNELF